MPVMNARFMARSLTAHAVRPGTLPATLPRLPGMEAFFVVLIALVMLGVGVVAVMAARRLSALTDATTKDEHS